MRAELPGDFFRLLEEVADAVNNASEGRLIQESEGPPR